MKTYSIHVQLLLVFCLFLLLMACSKSPSNEPGNGGGNGNPPTPSLSVNVSAINFPSADSTYGVTINSNTSWTVSDDQSWITTSLASGSNNGSFSITVTANQATSVRTGVITVNGSNLTRTIAVSQAANLNGGATNLANYKYGIVTNGTFYWNGSVASFSASDDFGSAIKMETSTTGETKVELVNADQNNLTVTASSTPAHYHAGFSNINDYNNTPGNVGTTTFNNPDTTGKIYFRITKIGGGAVVPAQGSSPAHDTLIFAPGTVPANTPGEGKLGVNDYQGNIADITVPFLQQMLSGKWKITNFNPR